MLLLGASPVQAEDVSAERLRADVTTLVGFGTRHTMSDQEDPARGIGAVRRWAEREFGRISAHCGACLTIVLPERMVQGDRVPVPTRLVNVVAIQRGIDRPNEVVIVQAHIDSRVTDVMNANADAPGANDDGSGTALVLEAARVLSQRRYPVTIVYAILSGEEQGLLGGKLIADFAREQGWTVKAVLNNDIVGGTRGSDGVVDDTHVRVFSEGPRADGDDAYRAAARRMGGENDSPSRNLSRLVARLAQPGLEVLQVWRSDRMGRGGDHLPFLEAGIPAVRFSVAIENYDHQHQDVRTENGIRFGDTIDAMDFPYLARVTALNIAVLDRLAGSPIPPAVTMEGAVSTSTVLHWSRVNGARDYRIYKRRTDARDWDYVMQVSPDRPEPDGTFRIELEGLRGDDWLIGVSSVAASGAEGPIASAVPGGAFKPLN